MKYHALLAASVVGLLATYGISVAAMPYSMDVTEFEMNEFGTIAGTTPVLIVR